MKQDEFQQFDTGAVRSSDAQDVRYDLITPIGLRRLAETYAEGAKKYSDHNWLKGFPMSDVMNHCIRHIYLWLSGDSSEDHLAHAAWNLFTLMHFEETREDLNDIPTRHKSKETNNSWEKLWQEHYRRIKESPIEYVLKDNTHKGQILCKGGVPLDVQSGEMVTAPDIKEAILQILEDTQSLGDYYNKGLKESVY